MARGTWVKTNTPPKNTLTATAKSDILSRAQRFVDDHHRKLLEPPPKGQQFNYVIDYTVKWHGPYLIFTAKYACPGPNAVSPGFDHAFARLGCFARDRFNLWARRHNDEWLVLDDGLTLEECFKCIVEDPWFQH
jgi:hypothetical protein